MKCPVCGNAELFLTPEGIYKEIIKENGRACVGITCYQCGLSLTEFTAESYISGLAKLTYRWSRLRYEHEKIHVG